jgi:hypothetical protein
LPAVPGGVLIFDAAGEDTRRTAAETAALLSDDHDHAVLTAGGAYRGVIGVL